MPGLLRVAEEMKSQVLSDKLWMDAQAGGIYQLQADRHGDDGDVCIGADCFRCCKTQCLLIANLRTLQLMHAGLIDARTYDAILDNEQYRLRECLISL